jgi:hypothetical protein
MVNKKLIALLVAAATITGNACASEVVEGTGRAAGEAVGGASDVAFGTVGGIFGGKGVQERMDEREERREQKRAEREQKRAERESKKRNRK